MIIAGAGPNTLSQKGTTFRQATTILEAIVSVLYFRPGSKIVLLVLISSTTATSLKLSQIDAHRWKLP